VNENLGRDADRSTLASSFRAKGLVFHGAREFYDLSVPGGWAAVVEHAERAQPSLASFLRAPIVAGGWYDVMPILPLSRSAAALRNVWHGRLVRENAAWLARRDLAGVYRFMMRLASTEMVAMRLPALSMRYFDFGQADATMIGHRILESNRRGIPLELLEWFQWVVEGFTPVALAMTGAHDVKVRSYQLSRGGALGGLNFRITWV